MTSTSTSTAATSTTSSTSSTAQTQTHSPTQSSNANVHDRIVSVRDNIIERINAIAEFKWQLMTYLALFIIVITAVVVRSYVSFKHGYFYDPVDLISYDMSRRILLYNDQPHTGLGLFAVLSFHCAALFGVWTEPPVHMALLSVLTTSIVGTLAAFALGRLAKDSWSALICAAFFALTPALVQPTTAGRYAPVVIGLPVAMLAFLFYAQALRDAATLALAPNPHVSWSSSIARFFLFSVPWRAAFAAFFGVYAQHSWRHGLWLTQVIAAHTAVMLALGARHTVSHGVFETYAFVHSVMFGMWALRLSLDNITFVTVIAWAVADRFSSRVRQRAPLIFVVWCVTPLVLYLLGIVSLDAHAALTFDRNGLGWLALFRDFHVPLFAVPAGLQYCVSHATSVSLFFAVYVAFGLLLLSMSESHTQFAAPALCIAASVGVSAIARGYVMPNDATFRRRTRAVSRESTTSIVLFLLLMSTFFVVYAWTSAMHRVVTRPSLAVQGVPSNDEALETIMWMRINTNRTTTLLAFPESEAFNMITASNRRFHVLNLNPGAMRPNEANSYQDEEEYFRTRRLGDSYDAAVVLLSPEDTAWNIMREFGGAYVLARCSPFDTGEYSQTEFADDSAVDSNHSNTNSVIGSANSVETDNSSIGVSSGAGSRVVHLSVPQLRFAQLAVDSRLFDSMRVALTKQYEATLFGSYEPIGAPVRPPAATLAAHTLLQNHKQALNNAALGNSGASGASGAAMPTTTGESGAPSLLTTLCGARAAHFRSVFASYRGQFRLFRSKTK